MRIIGSFYREIIYRRHILNMQELFVNRQEETKEMKPLTIIYWLRMGLGVFAGAISAILSYYLLGTGLEGTSILLYSISLTLLIYLITFRLIKMKFQNKVEKASKITMTGIGMYFFAWLAFYVLFYTIIISVFGPGIPAIAPIPTPTPT